MEQSIVVTRSYTQHHLPRDDDDVYYVYTLPLEYNNPGGKGTL